MPGYPLTYVHRCLHGYPPTPTQVHSDFTPGAQVQSEGRLLITAPDKMRVGDEYRLVERIDFIRCSIVGSGNDSYGIV